MEGYCHICGQYKPLSFEHVPPRSAYNNKTVLKSTLEDLLNLPPDVQGNYKISQKGAGEYTLCEKCNNNTGKWYGGEYVKLAHRALHVIHQATSNKVTFNTGKFYPLRFLKQVMSFFCSINDANFAKSNPDLQEFILNKDRLGFPQNMFLSMYLNMKGKGRYFPLSAKGEIGRGFEIISEFSFPPFGFVFSIDKPIMDNRLFDVKFFSSYGYNQGVILSFQLFLLATFSRYPADYRTMEEIKNSRIKNIIREFNKEKLDISDYDKKQFQEDVNKASYLLHRNDPK